MVLRVSLLSQLVGGGGLEPLGHFISQQVDCLGLAHSRVPDKGQLHLEVEIIRVHCI